MISPICAVACVNRIASWQIGRMPRVVLAASALMLHLVWLVLKLLNVYQNLAQRILFRRRELLRAAHFPDEPFEIGGEDDIPIMAALLWAVDLEIRCGVQI